MTCYTCEYARLSTLEGSVGCAKQLALCDEDGEWYSQSQMGFPLIRPDSTFVAKVRPEVARLTKFMLTLPQDYPKCGSYEMRAKRNNDSVNRSG